MLFQKQYKDLNFTLLLFPQQAQQGMEKAVKQLASAGDEQSKAEAQVAVDFHEALIQSVKA